MAILLFIIVQILINSLSQPLKMVKHIQTIHRQIADELFECV